MTAIRLGGVPSLPVFGTVGQSDPHLKIAMLSPGEIAFIKAEIARLEKARKECRDGGIQQQIEIWIEELKKKLS